MEVSPLPHMGAVWHQTLPHGQHRQQGIRQIHQYLSHLPYLHITRCCHSIYPHNRHVEHPTGHIVLNNNHLVSLQSHQLLHCPILSNWYLRRLRHCNLVLSHKSCIVAPACGTNSGTAPYPSFYDSGTE